MTNRILEGGSSDVLSEKKRRLFEILDKKQRAARAHDRGRGHSAAIERAALSPAQRRIWFLDQAAPGVAAFNHGAIVELAGRLDAVALHQVLTEIVRRHESLRTVFRSDGEGVWQSPLPQYEFALPVVDARGAWADEGQWLDWVTAVNQRPFDLASAPGIRALLLRLADERHWIVLTIHHVVFDAWSSGVLLREIGALLAAFSGGRASPLPELRLQCKDLARQSEAELETTELSGLRRYWQTRLAGVRAMPEWPYDFPPAAVETFRAGLERLVIGEARKKELHEFCRAHRMTFASVLLCAVNVLVWKYTGASDICIGIPVAGRDSPDSEALIGCFVNTLVVRTEMGGGVRLGEVVARTWSSFAEAYVHQRAAFDDVVRWTRERGPVDETPLFRVLFNYRNVDMEVPDLGGLKLGLRKSRPESMLLDLSVEIADRVDGFEIGLGYRRDRFRPTTIGRMLRQLDTILASIVSSSSVALADLDVEGALGAQQKLEWNETEENWGEETLVALWERRASELPDRVALSWGDECLTYAELDGQARALAAALGQGPRDDVVLVWLPRSPQAVVAMLGVLRAGAAYWVLDPNGPAARALELCRDVRPSRVITTAEHRAKLPRRIDDASVDAAGKPRVLELEEVLSSMPAASTREVRDAASPEHLAYVMATSGSTGGVKVVAAPHRGLLNRLRWMWRTHPFADGEVVAQKTSLSFVDSVSEIWGALLAGVRLRMLSDDTVRHPRALVRALSEQGITRITLVPSLLDAVLDELAHRAEPLSALRYCTASGEPLPGRTAERMKKALPHVVLLNLYGASEIAGDSTWHEWTSGQGRMPIGRPIANTTMHVLNASMHGVPLGARGELYVGGDGLSRGYWHRPDLTASRFVPDPYGQKPGARLYRTGDLGRYRHDGALEHLGRADRQVKIRGHRVELSEVESALGEHPAVSRAAVVARSVSPNDDATELVAYLELSGKVEGVRAMREFLRERVPEYMVPSKWLEVRAMPFTTTGKLDRRALSAAKGTDLSGPAMATARAPTKTEIELGRIIGQVLRVAEVGPEADFFDLGGHSLAVVQLAARVREAFGRELPLRAVFERPRVRELAELVEAPNGEEPQNDPIRRLETPAAPLSYAQESLWFLQRLNPASVAYNETFIARVQGELNVAALEASLRHVLGRHAALRTRFELVNDEPVQRLDEGVSPRIEWVDAAKLDSRGDDGARWVAARAGEAPFDLSAAPLVRVWLVHVGRGRHAVVFSIHHIVADAWSMRRLTGEVALAYRRLTEGLPLDEAEETVRYIDYASWQRERLGPEALREQIAYWRAKLAGATPLGLAGPDARTAVRGVETVDFFLPNDVVKALKELARARGATAFMAILGAWMALLSAASGQADVSVGCPVAHRPRRELESVVGLFVNTLVMRCAVSRTASFHELLDQVRGAALEAYAHQDCPFELLVRELRPRREGAHNSLFDVMFVFHPHQPISFDLSGLSSSLSRAESAMPKADWTLTITETPGDWAASLEFDTGRSARGRAQQLVRDFFELLAQIVRAPARPLVDLAGLADIAIAPARPERSPPVEGEIHALGKRELVPPSTVVEIALAEICRTLLHRDEVAVNLTFFELGGHSLLAIKFHLAIEKAFPQTISLQDLFDDLSLSALAKRIEARGRPAEGARTAREIDF